jgi:dimethylhistidine N-methyltransferase
MRHSAALAIPHPADRFAEDVRESLSRTPRQLPSRYLYDELGSALFQAITRLPWYRITRSEQQLLRAHGREILSRVEPLRTLIELGPGNGEKLSTLVSGHLHRAVTAHLIDVSAAALATATSTLASHSGLRVIAHEAEYDEGLADIARGSAGHGRTLVLFLGSNVGNFEPPAADALLRSIRGALATGDALLLGTDLVKPERDLHLAYDDPLGVTAAFNRNLLVRANRELGADFDLDGFDHRALWSPEASRIEMHLVSRRRQTVHVPASHLVVPFETGETIWTESSYKYQPGDVGAILEGADFRATEQWLEGSFALTLAEVR